MYLPGAFRETDLGALDRLAEAHDFAALVTVREGEPTVSHLPVLYRRDGERVELRGHWSRANAQAGHAGPALLILQGPHAYLSPGWYPDKHEAERVPTWNYALAHLHGRLEIFRDEAALADLVDALSQRHERRVGGDWRFEHEREPQRRQLRGIVGFRLAVERIELKFKLSQNHPRANRESVIAQLQRQQREDSLALAALMRERLDAPEAGD